VTTRERVVAEPPPIVAAPTPESEYARRSDPAYFKTGEGRNKRWSLAEKIGAALAGWATGGLGGGIRAATDRNYFNRLNNDQEIARLLPVIGERRQQEKASSDQAYRTAATQNIYDDNKRQREADAERERHNREEETRKARAEKSRALYNEAILKEKKAGRELNEKQAQSLMQYREWLIDRGNKMDDVKIRQIDERLKDYDLDRQSRESIAGANRTSKEGIATENRKVKRENDPLGLFQ
jgi:flagellar biosynthesis GTPase FlhF